MRWEEKFKKYNKNEADKRIKSLELKLNEKSITKEEYQELNKEKTIRGNIDKVANIMELRDKLLAEQEEIKNELKRRETLAKTGIENQKIEEEYDKLNADYSKLKDELKNADNKEDKEKIQEKIDKLNIKRQENNDKYVANQKMLLDNMSGKDKQRENNSKQELETRAFEIGIMISKCGIVASNLMKGLSWDSIEIKVQNAKYTSRENITEKAKEVNKTKAKRKSIEDAAIESETKKIAKDVQRIKAEQEKENQEIALMTSSAFLTNHPRIAKFVNGIKNGFNSIVNKFKKGKNEKQNTENETIEEGSKTGNSRDEFFEYIKVVAEKGIEGAAKQDKEARKEKAKEQFKKNKEAAYKRETEKFGKDYADKSYKSIEEQEEQEL